MLAFIGWIAGIFIGVGSAVAAALAAITPLLLSMWSTLMTVFKTVGGLLVTVARHVYRFVEPVWTRVLKPAIDVLVDFWVRFKELLSRVVDPILSRLEWIYDLFTKFYNRFVVPILDWLERARLILFGLGALGVGWASDLAGLLGRLQEKINDAFRNVEQYLYQITSIINDLLAPEGWIKGKIFLTSVQRWSGGAMSILIGIGIDPNLDLRVERTRETAEIPTLPMVRDRWTELVIRNHPAVRAAVQAFKEGKFATGEVIHPQ